MSIATIEVEIVDVSECQIKLSCDTAIFQIIRHSFKFPEAWVATSRLDHHLLA